MLFKKNKIDLIEGFGSVTDDGNVKIGGQFDGTEIQTDRVILACGSVAKPILDLSFGERILDTAGMWLLNEQPSRLCVIGAGASGVEIASALGRLGTEVLLLEALDQILPLEDEEISKACAREIKKQNVRIETGAKVEGAEASDSGVTVSFNGEKEEFDYLVIAAGRGAGRGGARAGRGGDRARRPRHGQGGRPAAHLAPRACGRSATWCPGPRWPTRRPTRASSRWRTRPGTRCTRSTTGSCRR